MSLSFSIDNLPILRKSTAPLCQIFQNLGPLTCALFYACVLGSVFNQTQKGEEMFAESDWPGKLRI